MQITEQNSQKIYIAARGLRRERGKCQPRYKCHPEGLQGVWQPSLVPWGALGSSHPPAEGVSGIVPPAQ